MGDPFPTRARSADEARVPSSARPDVHDSLEHLTGAIVAFRDERDWKQFHHPKDLAVALAIEAAEVLEVLRFKSPQQIDEELPRLRQRLGEELSDCLFFVLLMAHDCGIDLRQALPAKLEQNALKYPAERVRGKNRKYDEYLSE